MRPTPPAGTRVLIISRSAPRPYHGSTMHMEDFIQGLKMQRCEVHYLALCPASQGDLARSSVDFAYFPEAQDCVLLEFDAPVQDWESRTVDRICRQVGPAVVIADYSWLGAFFDGPYFGENPSARKLIFVHDLRVRITASYVRMGIMKSEDNPWNEAREGSLLARADALLTLNEEDQRLAAALAPQARVLRMGMSVSPREVDPAATVPGRCLYVAANANENLFAAMWLLRYAWPRVAEAHPSASLVICGSIGDGLKRLADEGHEWLAGLDRLNVWIEGRKDDLHPDYWPRPRSRWSRTG